MKATKARRFWNSSGILSNRNFVNMWIGQSVSMLGSQITLIAVPLIAAINLNATPFEMGILRAVEYAPFLMIGLFAGVWVDYLPKRPLLVAADFGRAFLLCTIPILGFFGYMNMFYLSFVIFVVGCLTTVYVVGYTAILPHILNKDQLIEGNAKTELSMSVASLAGPSFAGLMVQWISGVYALLLDAISFIVSGLMMRAVVTNEPERKTGPQSKPDVWKGIIEGIRYVFNDPFLRSILACSTTTNFFSNMTEAVIILYATRELGFTPVAIGVLMGLAATGSLLSALASDRLIKRFGFGRVIVGSAFFLGIGNSFLLGATGNQSTAFGMMLIARFCTSFLSTIYNISQISFRQSVTKPEILGRVSATVRVVVWGVIPLGALVGGILGSWIGLYGTITIAVCGGIVPFLWVFFSPVRTTTIGKLEPAQSA